MRASFTAPCDCKRGSMSVALHTWVDKFFLFSLRGAIRAFIVLGRGSLRARLTAPVGTQVCIFDASLLLMQTGFILGFI